MGDLAGLSSTLLNDAIEQLSTSSTKVYAIRRASGEAHGIAGGILEGWPDLFLVFLSQKTLGCFHGERFFCVIGRPQDGIQT